MKWTSKCIPVLRSKSQIVMVKHSRGIPRDFVFWDVQHFEENQVPFLFKAHKTPGLSCVWAKKSAVVLIISTLAQAKPCFNTKITAATWFCDELPQNLPGSIDDLTILPYATVPAIPTSQEWDIPQNALPGRKGGYELVHSSPVLPMSFARLEATPATPGIERKLTGCETQHILK